MSPRLTQKHLSTTFSDSGSDSGGYTPPPPKKPRSVSPAPAPQPKKKGRPMFNRVSLKKLTPTEDTGEVKGEEAMVAGDDLMGFFHRAQGVVPELSDDEEAVGVRGRGRGNAKAKGKGEIRSSRGDEEAVIVVESSDEEVRRRGKRRLKDRFAKKGLEASRVKDEPEPTSPPPLSEGKEWTPQGPKVIALSSTPPPEAEVLPTHPPPLLQRTSTSTAPPPPPMEPLAPIVSILISSPIDGANPLIVKRRLDQTLKEPRLHWCRAQGYGAEEAASVFLVWKKRFRIMDGTSCKGIGVKVEQLDNMFEEDGVSKGNVHFEAMTEEIFNNVRKGLPPNGIPVQEDEDENEEDLPQILLKLQTGGRKGDAFEIKVRESTTVVFLIDEYRKDRNIDPGEKVRLMFEGDYLDPENRVGDTDLEDDCLVDVIIG